MQPKATVGTIVNHEFYKMTFHAPSSTATAPTITNYICGLEFRSGKKKRE